MRKMSDAIEQRAAAEPVSQYFAIVKSVAADVNASASAAPVCEIELDGVTCAAAIATHIPFLLPGQKVAVLGADTNWLIVAAWPMPDQSAVPSLKFDPASGTLHIQAARLNLNALAMIELSCGEARLRLNLDGKAQIEGKEVLSAAIGANRIEGASIDLN